MSVAMGGELPSSEEMAEHAEATARLLKAIANPNRLIVLCALVEGELSVGEINRKLPLSQSALSQHLARFRQAGLVATRRQSQVVYYRIADARVMELMRTLYELYCRPALSRGVA